MAIETVIVFGSLLWTTNAPRIWLTLSYERNVDKNGDTEIDHNRDTAKGTYTFKNVQLAVRMDVTGWFNYAIAARVFSGNPPSSAGSFSGKGDAYLVNNLPVGAKVVKGTTSGNWSQYVTNFGDVVATGVPQTAQSVPISLQMFTSSVPGTVANVAVLTERQKEILIKYGLPPTLAGYQQFVNGFGYLNSYKSMGMLDPNINIGDYGTNHIILQQRQELIKDISYVTTGTNEADRNQTYTTNVSIGAGTRLPPINIDVSSFSSNSVSFLTSYSTSAESGYYIGMIDPNWRWRVGIYDSTGQQVGNFLNSTDSSNTFSGEFNGLDPLEEYTLEAWFGPDSSGSYSYVKTSVQKRVGTYIHISGKNVLCYPYIFYRGNWRPVDQSQDLYIFTKDRWTNGFKYFNKNGQPVEGQ